MSANNPCPPGQPEVCKERFDHINEKLDAIHNDFNELKDKVSNGLSDRVQDLSKSVSILMDERIKRELKASRYQTAFLSLVVALSTGATYFVVKHFNTHNQQQSPIQQPARKAVQ